MKSCPYCHKDLPDDAQFCTYCGQALEKKSKKEKDIHLQKNPRKNSWALLGLLLLGIGLFGFDFIFSMLINALHGNVKISFYISLILYIVSILCGAMSLYIDRKDRKSGYQPNGHKSYAYVCICVSLFVALMNFTQVIMK